MGTFKVWCHDERGQDESEARVITAYSADEAAREWAMRDDSSSAEYHIASGWDLHVTVRDEQGADQIFIVSGEAVPHYYARAAIAKATGE